MLLSALVFGTVGALILVLGLALHVWTRRVVSRCTEEAEGVVTGFTERDEDGFRRPVVEYAHGAETVTLTAAVSFASPTFEVGQRVRLRHPPDEPGNAVLETSLRARHLLHVAFIALGAIFIIYALLVVVSAWRQGFLG